MAECYRYRAPLGLIIQETETRAIFSHDPCLYGESPNYSTMMSENQKAGRPAHEVSDVSTAAVVRFGLGLLTSTVLVFLLIWGLFHYFAGREERLELPRTPMAATDQLPPEPRLQGSRGHESPPGREMKEMRAAQEATLHSYGWVDRNAGIVRIPVEQAMQKLLLEQGFPVRSAEPGQAPERKR